MIDKKPKVNKESGKKSSLVPCSVYVRVLPEMAEGGHGTTGEPAASKELQGWDSDSVVVGWRGSYSSTGQPLKNGRKYSFPKVVIPPEASQQETYETVISPLIDKLVAPSGQAQNAMVFAYGQTGTGKTYTMMGPDFSLDTKPLEGINPDWGLFPRVVYDIWSFLESTGSSFILWMSAVEFYLMEGRDLLQGNTPICMSTNNDLLGTKKVILRKPSDVIDILSIIRRNRHTQSTRMNKASSGHQGSSRSHAALILSIMRFEGDSEKYIETNFQLIDLAGAERPGKNGAERMSGMDAYSEILKDPTAKNISIGCQAALINYELYMIANEMATATETHRSGKPYRCKALLSTHAVRFLGRCISGKFVVSVVISLSQAAQCGWETWFSCELGTQFSQLKTPNSTLSSKSISKAVESINASINRQRKSLAANKRKKLDKYQIQRQCSLLEDFNQLSMLHELLGNSSLFSQDEIPSTFNIPKPTSDGFSFEGSTFSYPLEGIWDPIALREYEETTAFSLPEMNWGESLKDQREFMNAFTEADAQNPHSEVWMQKVTTELLTIDTTQFNPCDNSALKVYLYKPIGAGIGLKAIVYCHGGGGVFLSASHYRYHCARYAAENNAAVFNVEYRLAPENKAPRGIMDAVGTVQYLAQNAVNLGINQSLIFVAGDSGGGYIATGACIELTRKGLSGLVRLCIAIFPQVSDMFIRPGVELRGVESQEKDASKRIDNWLTPSETQKKKTLNFGGLGTQRMCTQIRCQAKLQEISRPLQS